MVVNLYGSYAYGSACIEQVARLQREILGDVAHQFVNLVEHIARAAFLHRLSVDVKMEVQCLHIEEFLISSFSHSPNLSLSSISLPMRSGLTRCCLYSTMLFR